MEHVPEGVLRRLVDEPLAVPDRFVAHLDRCPRCRQRNGRVRDDAVTVHRLFVRPSPVPDVESAWGRMAGSAADRAANALPRRPQRRRWRMCGVSISGGAIVVGGVAVAGVAAAATLSVVFAPSRVAPLPSVSRADLQAFMKVVGLDRTSRLVGSGVSTPWAYGTIEWGTRPKAVTGTSLASAEQTAGISVILPSRLPAGVRRAVSFAAEAPFSVDVTVGPSAGPTLSGSRLVLSVGGAVLIDYGGSSSSLGGSLGGRVATSRSPQGQQPTIGTSADGVTIPPLAVVEMQHPTVTSSGASTAQLEAFLLSRPGFPSALADEIRLVGNLATTLPVPAVDGITETSTTVGGAPAVILSAPGGVATAVVWEDRAGIIKTVGGLVDQVDALDVARQLG